MGEVEHGSIDSVRQTVNQSITVGDALLFRALTKADFLIDSSFDIMSKVFSFPSQQDEVMWSMSV